MECWMPIKNSDGFVLDDTGGAEPAMSALIQGFALTGLCDK